ncbi:glycosyltransferase family 4 protein [Spongiimicrobium salis]|uniref:glycosyltransferase family 4 protein n=1 Tax=Spongiimicrobium salis TaxID=1667022 RepID=UPI00374CDD30
MNPKQKLIRITTVPGSLVTLLNGQLKHMTQFYDVIGISSSYNGRLAQFSEEEHVDVIPVEMTRTISPFKDLRATYQLYRIFKREKPFIVHTHTPKAGTVGMLAAKLAGVPHRLHTIAGMPLLEATGTKRKLLDLVEKITYSCATKIYPNSFGLKDIIIQNKYTDEASLKVIANGSSNGIDTEHFDPDRIPLKEREELRKSLGIAEDDFVFVFIGRIVKDKGIEELTAAFEIINQKFPKTKLLLVGPFEKKLDPLSERAEKIVTDHKNVIYVGSQRDVRPYFLMAHIQAFPSYREGFPNVVMQAGALGIPNIVSNINGCNEIIEDKVNGVIIPVKNIDALANAMEWAIQNKEEVEKMGKVSREMIRSRFERNLVWSKLLEEYRNL